MPMVAIVYERCEGWQRKGAGCWRLPAWKLVLEGRDGLAKLLDWDRDFEKECSTPWTYLNKAVFYNSNPDKY